jgi:nucleoside-diphosphate-sugar epimerase
VAGNEHALVLGGTGFLGEPLVRQLLEEGVRLTILVHRRPVRELPQSCRVIRGHLAFCDLTWCESNPPNVVFHCARLKGGGAAGRRLAAMIGSFGNHRLLRRLGQLPKPPRVIYASGSLMYGSHGDTWVDETTPLAPTSFAREYIIAERPFLKRSAVPVVLVRPGWVVGNGSWLESFFLGVAEREAAVPIYGPDNWMTFIHREDCAAAMRRLARLQQTAAVYNLAVQPPLKQREFVEYIAAKLKLPVREKSLEGKERGVREAFSSSIKLRSRYEDLLRDLRFPTPFSAFDHALEEYRAHTRPRTSMPSG